MIFDDTLLSAHLDEELDGAVCEAVDSALAADPALVERQRLLAESKLAVASLSRPAIPVDLTSAVLTRIERDRVSSRRRPYYWIATAASLLFAFTLWLQPLELLGKHKSNTPPSVVLELVPKRSPVPAPREEGLTPELSVPPVTNLAQAFMVRPLEDPDAAARELMQRLLDRPDTRRIVIVVDAIDPAARAKVRDALANLPRKNPDFSVVSVAKDILIDPTLPGEGEVFATLMDWPERRQLIGKLEGEFARVVDQTVVDPQLGLQLADLESIKMGTGHRGAGLIDGPPTALIADRHSIHPPIVSDSIPKQLQSLPTADEPPAPGIAGPPLAARFNEGPVPVIIWLTTHKKV